LIFTLLFWLLFGWLADYSFPFGQALELILACFKGTISAKVNTLQQKLQRTDIVSLPSNKQQVQKLNNLEAQAWLYKKVLENLGSDPSTNHEKIAKTLEALEYKRIEFLQELEPRKPQRYRILTRIQDYARTIVASQAEKDYEQLQKIVTNLVFFTRALEPSPNFFSDVINKLATEIAHNADKVSPDRLRLAYRIDELLKILSTKSVFNSNSYTTNNNQAYSNEQLIINDLRTELQNATEIEQEQQNRVNELQNNLSQLSHQKSDLQKSVQAFSAKAKSQVSKIEELKSEKFQLNIQRSELEQRNRVLYQYYQQQQEEIANLKAQLSQFKRSQSYTSTYTYGTTQEKQQTPKRRETKNKISVTTFRQISNQDDYVYVKGHLRNGKYVKAHYRKRPRT